MIIYLLRHAEKLLGPNEDGLTPAGFARAQLLAGMLANSGITVAFRTQFVRSQQTMEPLKNMLGDALEIKTVELPNLAGC